MNQDPYDGRKPGISTGLLSLLMVLFVLVALAGLLLWAILK